MSKRKGQRNVHFSSTATEDETEPDTTSSPTQQHDSTSRFQPKIVLITVGIVVIVNVLARLPTSAPALSRVPSSLLASHDLTLASLRPSVSASDSRDFALHADGGQIACRLTSQCGGLLSFWSPPTALNAISDNMQIGNCWAIASSRGQLGLMLAAPIIPSAVTIDHIPLNIAADTGRAPRTMILWGVVEGARNKDKLKRVKMSQLPILKNHAAPPLGSHHQYTPLATFEYNRNAPQVTQTFEVFKSIRDAEIYFHVVVLEIVENWGSQTTCLYRVRIHGEEVETST